MFLEIYLSDYKGVSYVYSFRCPMRPIRLFFVYIPAKFVDFVGRNPFIMAVNKQYITTFAFMIPRRQYLLPSGLKRDG